LWYGGDGMTYFAIYVRQGERRVEELSTFNQAVRFLVLNEKSGWLRAIAVLNANHELMEIDHGVELSCTQRTFTEDEVALLVRLCS
jgi:hypothetical protein